MYTVLGVFLLKHKALKLKLSPEQRSCPVRIANGFQTGESGGFFVKTGLFSKHVEIALGLWAFMLYRLLSIFM